MGYGSFFLGKKKEPKKNRFCLSPDWITVIRFWGTVLFTREAACDTDLRCVSRYESAALPGFVFGFYPAIHLSFLFRDTANRDFFIPCFTPAVSSPPRKRGGSGWIRGASRT